MVLVNSCFKGIIVNKCLQFCAPLGRWTIKYYNNNKKNAGQLFLRSYFYGDKF